MHLIIFAITKKIIYILVVHNNYNIIFMSFIFGDHEMIAVKKIAW